MTLLELACATAPGRALLRSWYFPKKNAAAVQALGLNFPNVVGLAAGFDKDGKHIEALACLGFGHIEVGTVTPVGQPGNPQPRLFRLPADRALINRMGFNNEGVEALAARLKRLREKGVPGGLIIGGNIGKTLLQHCACLAHEEAAGVGVEQVGHGSCLAAARRCFLGCLCFFGPRKIPLLWRARIAYPCQGCIQCCGILGGQRWKVG